MRGQLVHRLLVVVAGITFLIIAWDIIRVLNHSTMTITFPLADQLLSRWDVALGFDWKGYFHLVAQNALLRETMAWAYGSLTILSVTAYLVMCLLRDLRRSLFFLEIFTFTAVVCTIFGAFFPARAAVDFYLGAGTDLSIFTVEPGLYHLASLERLRTGEPVQLVLGELPGLVTFPSFHTAAGVLLVAASWRTWLFLPSLLYALVMIASTPVYGGHYFVDLIAGTVVALVIFGLWARREKYRTLFSKEGTIGTP
jgi:membrane-associated phospholipid phosphatase